MESLLTYQDRDPAALAAHPANPRLHPDKQKTALAKSLETHGWLATVLVNDRTGRILDGHARVEHALATGLKKVPCIVIDVDEAHEKRILRDFDPIGEAREIDVTVLLSLIEETADEPGDVFDTAEVDRLKRLAGLLDDEWETDTERVTRMPESQSGIPKKIIILTSEDLYSDVRERVEIALEGIDGVTVR